MISTTVCPSSWNSWSLRNTTVCPRWMSGVVGSTPSFTRSGRPRASWRSSSPAGRASTAFRVRKRAASAGESVMSPMLDCRPLVKRPPGPYRAGHKRTAEIRSHGCGEPDPRGAQKLMQEPPTPILNPSRARVGRRFGRGSADGNGAAPPPPRPRKRKPKLKKLRLALIVVGLSILAGISTLFGMLMAVASDLPALENHAEYRAARNSVLYSDAPDCKEPGKHACEIAQLTGNRNRILLDEDEISPYIKNAVIAIEDRRFYHHEGVDYAGIARALSQDVLRRRVTQGGSTITQQFVKNALSAQGNRSVFQKLREASLAYHLESKWSKEKIITQYLNTVYFGNGAYGVEAAVRTYFGDGDEPEELSSAAPAAGVTLKPPEPEQDEEETDRDSRASRSMYD